MLLEIILTLLKRGPMKGQGLIAYEQDDGLDTLKKRSVMVRI